MIQKLATVSNNRVVVAYDYITDVIVILKDHNDRSPQRTYAGFDGLKEKFMELAGSFTEDYDVAFCIAFFKPNFTETIINS